MIFSYIFGQNLRRYAAIDWPKITRHTYKYSRLAIFGVNLDKYLQNETDNLFFSVSSLTLISRSIILNTSVKLVLLEVS